MQMYSSILGLYAVQAMPLSFVTRSYAVRSSSGNIDGERSDLARSEDRQDMSLGNMNNLEHALIFNNAFSITYLSVEDMAWRARQSAMHHMRIIQTLLTV